MDESSGRLEVHADPAALARHVAEWMTSAALVESATLVSGLKTEQK